MKPLLRNASRSPRRVAAALAAGAAVTGFVVSASPAIAGAATRHPVDTISSAVFVQSNGVHGNQVLAYARGTDGSLSFEHAYDTGGRGYREGGSAVDPLASQSSLTYDRAADLLIAVNAGSGTITTFHVRGSVLSQAHQYRAGSIPTSVASHGDLVYVLDAGGAGAVRGFSVSAGRLSPLSGTVRSLHLPAASPQFLNTPAQIGVTPDGAQVVVTTKANGSDIDVFAIGRHGNLGEPTVNGSATAVPFGFVFDPHGRLVDVEAGNSSVSTYAIDADGSLTNASSVSDGLKAGCWITEASGYYFVANAGSAEISTFQVSDGGAASLVSASAASTDGGPIDLAASADGSYLYVEAGGGGAIDEFSIGTGGALTAVGSITGLSGTGIEGIVAS